MKSYYDAYRRLGEIINNEAMEVNDEEEDIKNILNGGVIQII